MHHRVGHRNVLFFLVDQLGGLCLTKIFIKGFTVQLHECLQILPLVSGHGFITGCPVIGVFYFVRGGWIGLVVSWYVWLKNNLISVIIYEYILGQCLKK
jgi:hypothetical protein